METDACDTGSSGRKRFKSYYVVWKLKNKNTVDEKEISLNRTM